MPGLSSSLKRVVVGRPFASSRLRHERLPVRLALPTFAADALSSVAYAPDQILLALAVGGISAYAMGPVVGLAVAGVMGIVVITNRQIVREYPTGGGDLEVVEKNLGSAAGRVVGSALLVDYLLTVAVSTSQAARYSAGVLPSLHGHERVLALGLIGLLALVNLRGLRASGLALAIPVYLFMGAIGATVLGGAVEALRGDLGAAPSADLDLAPSAAFEHGLTALGAALLLLRAFSSGCAALTGFQAIGNGVPSFAAPKSRNAGITLVLLGVISSAMLMGILLLARLTGVTYVQNPSAQLLRDGAPVTAYQQLPVIGQIAQAVFSPGSLMFFVVVVVTALVLFIAANTAFQGFPNLASALARADYVPHQLRVRGDRLAYSNGILALTLLAGTLVWLTAADVTLLVQMYIVGVFVSFSLSRLGMTRHFSRRLRVATSASDRRSLAVGRVVSAVGFVLVTLVLGIVLATKFTHGAWVAVTLMTVLWAGMTAIRSHYRQVRSDLALKTAADADGTVDLAALPSRSHALVLVSTLDRPTIQALSVAAAARHTTLEALTIDDQDADVSTLIAQWRDLELQVPLRVMYSPYRAFAGPVLAYVHVLARRNPRDVVIVYIPEFLVGHWWEWFLHNHSARRLRARLSQLPRVVVSTVPWQLGPAREAAGQTRAEATASALARR